MSLLHIRQATKTDARTVAVLHALSWRNTYRNILSDEYLDNDLENERIIYWERKFSLLTKNDFVLIAENETTAVGFIAVLYKPEKGCDGFIDNLHVRADVKGLGIGGALMKAAAQKLQMAHRKGVYLWVLNGNDAAAGFYISKGASVEDTATASFGGKLVEQTRFVWRELDLLIK